MPFFNPSNKVYSAWRLATPLLLYFTAATVNLLFTVVLPDLLKRKSTDIDGDGIPNTSDNCILVANPTQVDDDTDAIGNDCDCAPLFANPIKDRPNLTFTYATLDSCPGSGT